MSSRKRTPDKESTETTTAVAEPPAAEEPAAEAEKSRGQQDRAEQAQADQEIGRQQHDAEGFGEDEEQGSILFRVRRRVQLAQHVIRGLNPRIHLRLIFFFEEMDCNQSRMFPTLLMLSAPKSGTPDFGVKPGNDGGERINFTGSHSRWTTLMPKAFTSQQWWRGRWGAAARRCKCGRGR